MLWRCYWTLHLGWAYLLPILALLFEMGPTLMEGKEFQKFKRLLDIPTIESWTNSTDPCVANLSGVKCINGFVETLDLRNLGLSGLIPSDSFQQMKNLRTLLLGNNSFTGPIPESLFWLQELTTLDLSYNSFSGFDLEDLKPLVNLENLSLTGNPINSDVLLNFTQFKNLTGLFCGDCGLKGIFPSSLSFVSSLKYLDLEFNNFTGFLPAEIWNLDLVVLGLKGNDQLSMHTITGIQPSKIKNLQYISLPDIGTLKLPPILIAALQRFQEPLCKIVQWIKCEDSSPNTPTSTQNTKSRSIAAWVIITGAVIIIATFSLVLVCCYRLWSRHSTKNDVTWSNGSTGVSHISMEEIQPVPPVLQVQITKVFTFRDLQSATDDFNLKNLVGVGGSGNVYRGVLPGGQMVAIKKINEQCYTEHIEEKEFQMEVDILSQLSHPNLIGLHGYCADETHRLIVYDYMPNGSLQDYLDGKTAGLAKDHLDFHRRLLIALGAAKALDYLHTGIGGGHVIIHRDFKASNVLLDNAFHARVSDFGLAKFMLRGGRSHVTTQVVGTFGYLDPHFTATGQLTVKSDVYGFGVVLFQLLTGRPPIFSDSWQTHHNLVSWSLKFLKDAKTLKSILDPHLGMYHTKCAYRLAILASKCVHQKPDDRPTMAQCVKALEKLVFLSIAFLQKHSDD